MSKMQKSESTDTFKTGDIVRCVGFTNWHSELQGRTMRVYKTIAASANNGWDGVWVETLDGHKVGACFLAERFRLNEFMYAAQKAIKENQ